MSTTTSTPDHAPPRPDQTAAELARLARVRNGVRAVLALGIAASVAANILHAQANPVGRVVAAWPPVALLLAIELLSRVPVARPWLSAARITATAVVAGIAAWVSYWHMVDVAHQYGETSTSAHLIPFSVDGLVLVASVCLVELGARTTTLHATTAPADLPATDTAAVEVPAAAALPADPQAGPGAEVAPAAATRQTPPRPRTTPGRATGGRSSAATAAAVARTRARHPEWTQAQIAERVGVTERTVRRYLTDPDGPPDDAPRVQPDPTPPGPVVASSPVTVEGVAA